MFTPLLRAVTALLGVGSFGTGVLAVFVTQNGTGTGVLLAFGGILLVLALFGNRIESLEFGGVNLRLRAAAAERLALAEESERQGDTESADRLRAEGQALLEAAAPLAQDYRILRRAMPSGSERTRAMEAVVERVRRMAETQPFDAEAVAGRLRTGSDEERVTALGMMQAHPERCDIRAVLPVIEHPRSPFEQYHALKLADMMIDGLDPDESRLLAGVVAAQRSLDIRRDGSRRHLRKQILRRLNGADGVVGGDRQGQ